MIQAGAAAASEESSCLNPPAETCHGKPRVPSPAYLDGETLTRLSAAFPYAPWVYLHMDYV